MSFQKTVNSQPAPAVAGDRASMNPVQCVLAGPGGLVAGTLGTTVGRFAWNIYATAGGPGVANSYSPTAPTLPDGFVANEQQATIASLLSNASMDVEAGRGVTEYDRGDFWAASAYGEAVIGNKVYANLFSGEVLAAATGAFPTTDSGVSAVTVSSGTVGTYELVVGTVTSGVLAVGQLVTGAGIPDKTYIESQHSGSAGAAGTYHLSQAIITTFSSAAVTTTSRDGVGGSTITASANNASTTVTIESVTAGHVHVGQYIKGTSIATGAYISALGTFTEAAGTGTVTISAATTGTITSASVETSSWIETPWSVKSAGNVGDLIKIGIKN